MIRGIFSLRNFVAKQLMKVSDEGIMSLPDKGKIDFGEMMKFRWAEPVDIDLREFVFDASQQVLIPIQLKLRVKATLHQNLVPAKFNRFSDFL